MDKKAKSTTINQSPPYQQSQSLNQGASLFSNGPVITYQLESTNNSHITYISENITQFGYESDEIISQKYSFYDFFHIEDILNIKNSLKDAMANNKPNFEFKARLVTKKETTHWIYSFNRFISDKTSQQLFIEGYFIDITEQNIIETRLNESEERWQLALEGNNDGIWDWDLKKQEAFYSSRLKNMLGYHYDELTPDFNTLSDKIHPDDIKQFRNELSQHLRGDTVYFYSEHRIRCKNDTYKWVLNRGKTKRNNDGAAIRMVCSISDITDRKNFEKEIITAKEQAEKANKLKSDFLANISHETRTPLNSIIGMCEILKEPPINKDQQHYISILKNASENLLFLINDLLDLSKVESDNFNIHKEAFNIKDILVETTNALKIKANSKSLYLKTDFSLEEKILIGAPHRIKQIINNIIDNAIKFTPKGGINFKVRTKLLNNKKVKILFEITDTGIGIPKEKIKSIFNKFVQADPTTIRNYEGTGLGLAITKKLIDLMNGKITVKSDLNKGSTFSFNIYCKKATENQIPPKTNKSKSKHLVVNSNVYPDILLVEDSKDNIELIKLYLKESRINLDIAENGEIAFEKYKKQKYNLIIMDMQMPIMDGYSATKAIRSYEKDNKKPRTPIIALTAYAFEEDKKNIIKAGCDAHLSKPIYKSTLLNEIIKHIPSTDTKQKKENITKTKVTISQELKELIPEYLLNRSKDIQTIQECLLKQDFLTIERLSHSMKGSGAGYGFNKISAIGLDIESAAKHKNEKCIVHSLTKLDYFLKNITIKYQ
jgi:PAS domain S-box-containing protein